MYNYELQCLAGPRSSYYVYNIYVILLNKLLLKQLL